MLAQFSDLGSQAIVSFHVIEYCPLQPVDPRSNVWKLSFHESHRCPELVVKPGHLFEMLGQVLFHFFTLCLDLHQTGFKCGDLHVIDTVGPSRHVNVHGVYSVEGCLMIWSISVQYQ